ncbi:MAG: hypothetical protein EBU90_09545 [Proteobacteria bacterium]|nr:hypothetical protein [Pseudomonadota bacterium]NBP16657.1 hypothetical protein [bacterium]
MMHEILQILQGVLERGLIFSVVVAGVYLATQLINFDNLSIEGAFGLGGALTALLLSYGVNPWVTLLCALLAGIASGVMTGYLHKNLKLNPLISGIVMTTGLFSILLKIAGSNMMINQQITVFTTFKFIPLHMQKLAILSSLIILLFTIIAWFLKTEIGFMLHALGDNPQMLINVGKRVDRYTMLGIGLSNGLAALSGALFVHYTGYFSIWASVGILIIGLAGMILAQSISKSFGFALLLGAIFYQVIITLTFELQLDQSWNKLVTAVLIVLLIVLKDSLRKP